MEKLFEEFQSSNAQQWKNQIVKDLKGEAFETLQWHNENGFIIEPFYTSENLCQNYDPAFTHNDWEVCVKSNQVNASTINLKLLENLDRGATSFELNIANHDLNVALRGVKLNYIHSTFEINKDNVHQLRSHLENNYDINDVYCSVFLEDFDSIKSIDSWYRTIDFFLAFKKMKALSFNALPYHQLNALAYYEVAIIFSGLVEQLEYLRIKGDIFSSDVVVKTGVNSDFFLQIAKLRAIRRLWNCIKEDYQIKNNLYLIVETSLTNKSIADKHNNLLRSSVEAMAAVAGGCNELTVNDFDIFNTVKDSSSSRLAINQQLIIKHESYFDKMADVACGSYYIESLTDLIASKALDTFKRFESEGGYFKCIEKNIFKSEIDHQASIKQNEIDSLKQIIIGVNKFRNDQEVLNLSDGKVAELKNLPIHNPVLNYELQSNTNQHA